MIKAGIFDIGGVLINWTNLPMYEDIDQTLGITEEQRNEVWGKYMTLFEVGKITEEEFWQGFLKDTEATGTLPEESLFLREFRKRFTVNEKVLGIARILQEKGLKTAILSNTIDPHANFMKTTGLFDGFDVVTLSNEVGYRKPEKEIYQRTVDQLRINADEIFFIDDLPENVEGAKSVGIKGILFRNVDELKEQLIPLGVTV